MPRSTTTSTKTATSIAVQSSSSTALPRSLNGVNSPCERPWPPLIYQVLPGYSDIAVEVVRSQLIGDGIDLWEDAMIQGVESHGNGIAVMVERDGGTVRIDGSHLMVAALSEESGRAT